ncbi:MAG: hypothetical protein NZ741_10380 [Armatimonadetes bacterium]|nr:hypothetical protein [Armatimonadota bacterium]
MLRFTDLMGRMQAVRGDAPLPVAGGQVLAWLSDDFALLDTARWTVSGSPSVASSELTVGSSQSLLSVQTFHAPCLLEAVITMTARAAGDDFRIGFYRDDNNLVEWAATGATAANMDALMRAGGVDNHQTGMDVGAANNSYRLASIYIGLGEVIWSYRPVNALLGHGQPRRIVEHGIPDGPFRVRLAGLAGTSQLRVHRVTAYQLADVVLPGALGHMVESLAVPVRLVNTPFAAQASTTTLNSLSSSTDTFSALAAGSTALGSTRTFSTEQLHVQAYVHGDQPFTVWLEGQTDGTNWQVIWMANSTDANPEGTPLPARYYAVSPIFQWIAGHRGLRARVKNTGTASGTFRVTIGATML